MKAITREEKIIQGENLTPITRKEMFLAKLVGKEIETPHPITRAEKIMSGEQLSPITREEMFLAKAVGQGIEVPTPITRKEIFLNDVSFEEPTYHTIRFISEGVVLQESILAYGEIPVYVGEEPTKTDYKFVGWTPKIAAVTGDVDYVAKFKSTKSITRSILDGTITEYSDDVVTSVGKYAFYNSKKLTRVSLPSVNKVNGRAFEYCIALTDISLPSATSIDSNAFSQCTSLASVSIDSVKSISTQAFYGCTALTDINLPSVTSLGGNIFQGCTSLKGIHLPETPPTVFDFTFQLEFNSECVFYIPTGSLAAYQANEKWNDYMSKYTFVEEDR